MFRVQVPPGLVGLRRTPCPAFPQQPPDEPAPGCVGVSWTNTSISARLAQESDRTLAGSEASPSGSHGADGRPAQQSVVRPRGAHVGLECGFRLEIDLEQPAGAVELLLVRFAAPPKIAAISSAGSRAATASMSAPEGQPESVVLEGRAISRVVIDAPQDEVVLLDFIATRPSGAPEEADGGGRPSRFPQPPFRLDHATSMPGVAAAVATTPVCRVYDIELSRPHLTVRVHAGLPAMLAIAMRDGKAVNTQLLSAAGGEQSVAFQNQFVDRVLLYATAAATHLTICTEKLEPKEDDERWRDVPLIAKNVHVPVRSVNPALSSAGAEAALAASRLLAGESFDATSFDEVAALMNDSSQDAADSPPPTRCVLTRETRGRSVHRDPGLAVRALAARRGRLAAHARFRVPRQGVGADARHGVRLPDHRALPTARAPRAAAGLPHDSARRRRCPPGSSSSRCSSRRPSPRSWSCSPRRLQNALRAVGIKGIAAGCPPAAWDARCR